MKERLMVFGGSLLRTREIVSQRIVFDKTRNLPRETRDVPHGANERLFLRTEYLSYDTDIGRDDRDARASRFDERTAVSFVRAGLYEGVRSSYESSGILSRTQEHHSMLKSQIPDFRAKRPFLAAGAYDEKSCRRIARVDPGQRL